MDGLNSDITTPLLPNYRYSNFMKYYWKILIIISAYYLLPSLQFVIFQVHDENVQCYYNYKCKHDFRGIPAFNNVISNIFYTVFGLLFLVIVRLCGNRVTDGISEYGLHKDLSLYYSLGIVLFLEGICSSLYHICPSKLNFQFDTTFMFIGTALMFLTLYQKRHQFGIPSPMKTYSFLAIVVLINILPLSGFSSGVEIWYWMIIIVLISYLMIFGSIYIYYGKEYDIDINSWNTFCWKIRHLTPKDIPKFMMLVLLNSFTLGMVIYAGIVKPNFTMWMLSLFIINMVIYFLFYIINKIKNSEPISKSIWLILVLDIICLIAAIIFYEKAVTDKLLTPNESKELNKPCILFNYFDYHDIWHILSGIGLFLFINIVFFLDRNLNNTISHEIAIF